MSVDVSDISLSAPSDFQQLLQGKRSALAGMLEVDYGLLDTMFESQLIDLQQFELVKSKPTASGRINQLLDDVVNMSSEKQEQFLSALQKKNQSHVVNYIRNNGQQPTTETDNWPIYTYVQWCTILQHWSQLKELIDTRCGLLDDLLESQCINRLNKEAIDEKMRDSDRNEQLLFTMQRKSVAVYKQFTQCLYRTLQCRAASILNPNSAGSFCQPLTDQQRSRVESNYRKLTEFIECDRRFMMNLTSRCCITDRQREFIESATSPTQSKERLLTIIMRGSQSQYDQFVECLEQTYQSAVLSILKDGGDITEVVAKTSGSGDLPQDERNLVEQFKRVMENVPSEVAELMVTEINQHLARLLSQGVHFAAMKTQHSIKLFFICRSLPGLMYLRDLFNSGELKDVTQGIFTSLLNNQKRVVVDELLWDKSKYYESIQNLSAAAGLSVSSRIYRLACQSQDVVAEPSASSVFVEKLPHELVEMVLIKATGLTFVLINKITTGAAVCALTTIETVSHYWHETLVSRASTRTLIRRYFNHVCHPYTFNPERVATIDTHGGYVRGVARLKDQLYVITFMTDTIQVFDVSSAASYQRQDSIKVRGLVGPLDIGVCNTENCLYIIDTDKRCIWRVNLSAEITTDEFIVTDYVPLTLSVQSTRLVITSMDGDAVHVYNCKKELLSRVQLPKYVYARHAVETSRGTFMVSHRARALPGEQKRKAAVSEITSTGVVIRYCEGLVDFNEPVYMTVDDVQHVLMTDRLNSEIFHLNSDLELTQVLLNEFPGQPWRLFYSKEDGLLYVCYYYAPNVDVYRVSNAITVV